ncbi:MAG: M12 family metallo-peptidase [Pseudomonadota bacterium]
MRSTGLKRTNLASTLCISLVALIISNCIFQVAYATPGDRIESAFSFRNTVVSEGKLKAVQSQALISAPGMKSWQIDLNPKLKSLVTGGSLRVPLPSGGALDMSITSSKTLNNGDVQIIGEFVGGGRALLTINDRASFGSIISDSHNLLLGWDSAQGQFLVDRASMTDRNLNLDADFRVPVGFEAKKLSNSITAPTAAEQAILNSGGKTRIDLLVVYSREFGSIFGSPLTRINQLVGFSNDAFDRSGILIQLNLVSAVELPFDNSRGGGAILTDATASRGDFSDLAALRDQFGADLVAVLPASSGSSASGVAWISGDDPDSAFSVTRLSPRCCDSVFTHEIGHNLGSGHEHQSANPSQSSPCRFSFTGYSCGHGNSAAGWGTIMSYLNDRAIGYKFSNLDSTCLGQPCGIAQGNPNAADNRTSFNISRSLVANFRGEVSTTPLPPSPPPSPLEPINTAEPWLTIIIDLLLVTDP